ncbi:type IV pilus biogenesis protein PilM [Rahnella sp. BCC 1045]|uniref:type IV pilus biogenesis protein PilM n=1 Tax=Rahnella sp. BCC 1045 TaxID=2816251 RepID=UPI001C261840|nr:type IV pilus biogenesis protein PilM [Rahnella sp. BCC 1045]MBU9819684.1 type IV pilus biogenesis protein PilM [Rahnella sp. BCC 1045]
MIVIYWILAMLSGLFLTGRSQDSEDVQNIVQNQQQSLTLLAAQSVRYMNRINDWRYVHPDVDNTGVSAADLSWTPPAGLNNVISAGRTFVWQADQPGLMAALLTQTRASALVGRVSQRHLTDSLGNDMQVTVPEIIPDNSLVYLN